MPSFAAAVKNDCTQKSDSYSINNDTSIQYSHKVENNKIDDKMNELVEVIMNGVDISISDSVNRKSTNETTAYEVNKKVEESNRSNKKTNEDNNSNKIEEETTEDKYLIKVNGLIKWRAKYFRNIAMWHFDTKNPSEVIENSLLDNTDIVFASYYIRISIHIFQKYGYTNQVLY